MSLLARLAIYLGIAAVVFGSFQYQKHKYDESRRAEGRAEVQTKWDADKAERLRAYAKLMSDYVGAQQDAERLQKEKDDARKVRENAARQRADAIPRAVRDMRIPLVAGVLNDVHSDAGGGTAAPATGGSAVGAAAGPADPRAAGGDTSVGLWADWSVTMRDVLYAQCVDTLTGLQNFYNNLRSKGVPQ
jgi:hypothetical protein